jgi:hypothetical protein
VYKEDALPLCRTSAALCIRFIELQKQTAWHLKYEIEVIVSISELKGLVYYLFIILLQEQREQREQT